jgi:hypothetical protein
MFQDNKQQLLECKFSSLFLFSYSAITRTARKYSGISIIVNVLLAHFGIWHLRNICLYTTFTARTGRATVESLGYSGTLAVLKDANTAVCPYFISTCSLAYSQEL